MAAKKVAKKKVAKKKAAKKAAVKAAPAVKAISTKMTKTQIIASLAETTGLTKKEIAAVMSGLGDLVTHPAPHVSGGGGSAGKSC